MIIIGTVLNLLSPLASTELTPVPGIVGLAMVPLDPALETSWTAWEPCDPNMLGPRSVRRLLGNDKVCVGVWVSPGMSSRPEAGKACAPPAPAPGTAFNTTTPLLRVL